MRNRPVLACCCAGFVALQAMASDQMNSWTNGSGAWEHPHWSLGELPASNHTVLLTNSGSKTVSIGAVTAQSFPDSLNVGALVISSPAGSLNTLLLDDAGTTLPLTARSVTIGSNSVMQVLSSALHISGPPGVGMSVGGEFTQDEGGIVTGGQVDVGYNGPGVYNLHDGLLAVDHVWVGGPFSGVFNQTGGINFVGILHLDPTGTYNLSGGAFGGTVYFNDAFPNRPVFRQTGGRVTSELTIHRGDYLLEAGISSGVIAPVGDGETAWSGHARVLQTGGTNLGPLDIGSSGDGEYVLLEGASCSPWVLVGPKGRYAQSNGVQVVQGTFSIEAGFVERNTLSWGSCTLDGGHLFVGNLRSSGSFRQRGGTNVVEGDLTMEQTIDHAIKLTMQGGILTASNLTSWRGVVQSGGTVVVKGDLVLFGTAVQGVPWFGPDYNLVAGELAVSNITLDGAVFGAGGSVVHSGTITLRGGTILAERELLELGTLKLDAHPGRPNELVLKSDGGPCVVQFAAANTVNWNASAVLDVVNWHGSLEGNGTQQVRFSDSAGAVTQGQASRIRFQNPAGLQPGTYSARVLASGEIVPSTEAGGAAAVALSIRAANGISELYLLGQQAGTYEIEFSNDLKTWEVWTNLFTTGAEIRVTDETAMDQPRRFYRARRVE